MGIDLGTTNSAVAHIVDGQPVCIPNQAGDTLTPSIVSFQADGSTLVGRAAKQAQSKSPDTTYYSVKRLIGRSWADAAVQQEAARLAYTVSCVSGDAHSVILTRSLAHSQPKLSSAISICIKSAAVQAQLLAS